MTYFVAMMGLGALRVIYCESPVFTRSSIQKYGVVQGIKYASNDNNNDDFMIEDFYDIMLVAMVTLLVVFSGFFMYFTYDFLDDFLKGVRINQTTFENYEENTTGGRFGESICMRMYFGDTWKDTFLPIKNSTNYHNYLEVLHPFKRANETIAVEKAVQRHSVYNEFYHGSYSYDESRNSEYKMTDDYLEGTPYYMRTNKLIKGKK